MGDSKRAQSLYCGSIQVELNPILSMQEHVPTIQEGLRQIGYDDFDIMKHESSGQNTLFFCNAENTKCMSIRGNKFSFSHTVYQPFKQTLESFLSCINIIHQPLRFSYIDKIFIEYTHVLEPVNDFSEDQEKDLAVRIFGLEKEKLENILIGFSETNVRIIMPEHQHCLVNLSVTVRNGLPLSPAQLKIEKRFQNINGLHATIEIVPFFEKREAFNIENIRNQAITLEKAASEIFQGTAIASIMNAPQTSC